MEGAARTIAKDDFATIFGGGMNAVRIVCVLVADTWKNLEK
jgi:hypothetical protein